MGNVVKCILCDIKFILIYDYKTLYTVYQTCYTKIMKEQTIELGFASVGTLLLYLFGGWDIALQCLITAIVLDYISGLIKAYNTKTLSSKIGIKGLLKKVGILCVVILSVLLDRISGETGVIRTMVIYYFVANEGLSVLENLAEAGLPIPKVIKDALLNLQKDKGSKTVKVNSKKKGQK